MSQLRQLYTNLAAKTINFTREDGTAAGAQGKDPGVTCDDLNAVQQSYSGPDLPHRFLLPGDGISAGGNFEPIAFGLTSVHAKVGWRIADICLWSEVGQGEWNKILPDLVRYAGAYADLLGADQAIGFGAGKRFMGMKLSGIDIIKNFQWPPSTNSYFFAVVTHFNTTELIN